MTKLLAVATTLAFLSTPVWAVEGEVVLEFGSSAQDSSTPITVIAKEVTFDRDGRKALFSGDVTVAHDTVKLNADRAEAFSTAADSSKISYVVVHGNVNLVTEDGRATSNEGEYHVEKEYVELRGDVVLYFNDNTFRGSQLHYDIQKKESKLTGSASNRASITKDN